MMTTYTSPYTGNTRYISNDGRFSSMSQKPVECWDNTMTGKPLDKKDVPFWSCAGCLNTEVTP